MRPAARRKTSRGLDVRVFIDTVAWVRLENGRILCARPRGKGIFYIPGGKREGTESDLQTLLREITEELTVALLPDTVTHVGTYEADQPDGHPDPRGGTHELLHRRVLGDAGRQQRYRRARLVLLRGPSPGTSRRPVAL